MADTTTWIINASPLILLARIGRLNWAVRAWDIDPGESQVIAHALRGQAYAILDDAAARRCAQSLGLRVRPHWRGLARQDSGLDNRSRPWVEKLRDVGMFADGRLIQTALSTVGE